MPHLPAKHTRPFHHFEEAITTTQNNFCTQVSTGFNAYLDPAFICALKEALASSLDLVLIFLDVTNYRFADTIMASN